MAKMKMAREMSPEELFVYDYHRKNKAVIINHGGDGMIVDFVGGHLSNEIEASSHFLGDLGLDDAPDGISIWEGWYWYFGDDGDSEARGEFRDPTDEEWEVIKAGGCPWDHGPYTRGAYCDAPPVYRIEGTVDGRHAKFHVCEEHRQWPVREMFDEGFEMRGQRLDELGRINLSMAHRNGCYAPKGWKVP